MNKTKKRLLFCVIAWIVLMLLSFFMPDDFRLIWIVLVSIGFLLFFLANFLELKGYSIYGQAKQKQKVEPRIPNSDAKPHISNSDNAFNYDLLIELAALVSNDDPDILKEVKESVFSFDEYVSFYRSDEWLSDDFSHEKYWERWYPNSKADPSFFYDYIGDKPAFCCLNMLEWLADKSYTAYIDAGWERDELIHSLNPVISKKSIPIDLGEIELLKDEINEKGRGIVHTHENLIMLNKHLNQIGYHLIDLCRGGDCYDLAIVSESVYSKIGQLDLPSLNGKLAINSF